MINKRGYENVDESVNLSLMFPVMKWRYEIYGKSRRIFWTQNVIFHPKITSCIDKMYKGNFKHLICISTESERKDIKLYV